MFARGNEGSSRTKGEAIGLALLFFASVSLFRRRRQNARQRLQPHQRSAEGLLRGERDLQDALAGRGFRLDLNGAGRGRGSGVFRPAITGSISRGIRIVKYPGWRIRPATWAGPLPAPK